MLGALPGDILLANDRVRFVVRGQAEGLTLLGLAGGCVIDAGTHQTDQLQELAPLMAFNCFAQTTVSVTRDGSDGVAEVTVEGTTGLVDVIAAVMPAAEMIMPTVTTYRLTEDATALEIEISVDTGKSVVMGDVMLTSGRQAFNTTNDMLASEGSDVSYALVSQDPLLTEVIGGITLALGPVVPPPVLWRQWLVVGDGSLSSVVDQALTLRGDPVGQLSGTVDDAQADVTVVNTEGDVVTRMRPSEDGAFSALLPVGVYDVYASGKGRALGASINIEVAADQLVSDLQLSAEPAGRLTVTTTEPLRITVQSDGNDNQIVPLGIGDTDIPLAPGTYTLHASRGYEYEPDTTQLTIEAGETATWSPVLTRSVDTTGWVASDFHLHSEWSTDSAVPLADRIVACAAEGIEYAVATDHDMVTDYTTAMPSSLKGALTVTSGVESSTVNKGHFCVWPLEPDYTRVGRGAPRWHGLDFAGLMDLFGAGEPGRVIQVNHPRDGSAAFSALDYEAAAPDPELLALFTFNAVEVHNGGIKQFDVGLEDWLSLVKEGLPIAATGVSDSHNIGALCGHARTYVASAGSDDPATLVSSELDTSILAGKTMVSAGPFVVLEEGIDAGTVHVRIAAPSWMDVDTLAIHTDNGVDQEIAVPPYEGDTVRLDTTLTLNFGASTFAVAVVRGDQNSPIYGPKTPVAVSPIVRFE